MKQNFKNPRQCFVTSPLFIFFNVCRVIAAKVWLGTAFLVKSKMSFLKSLFSMINNTNTPCFCFYFNSHVMNVFLYAMLTIKTNNFMRRSRCVNTFYNK